MLIYRPFAAEVDFQGQKKRKKEENGKYGQIPISCQKAFGLKQKKEK